jgi:hypothetical protein
MMAVRRIVRTVAVVRLAIGVATGALYGVVL